MNTDKTTISIEGTQFRLSAIWISLMLTYLLGDVMRIFSGDFIAGDMVGAQTSQGLYLGMAILFVIPIFMVFLSLTLKYGINRWANMIIAVVFFIIKLIGLPGYVSLYDQFLIIVGLVFNLITIWTAWKWREKPM